jgi:hypothetical protein
MASTNTPQAVFLAADKPLNALETASSSLDSIRIEINRYWDKMNVLAAHASSHDSRTLERELDTLIDSHDAHMSSFVKSINAAYGPATRSTQGSLGSKVPYDKAVVAKKRNKQHMANLQRLCSDASESVGPRTLIFPPPKRKKLVVSSPDIPALERILSEWVETTMGEFEILPRTAEPVFGRHTGPTSVARTNSLPALPAIPPHFSSQSGSKSASILRSMTYGAGQVEVKATIKGVAGFSFLVEGWDKDEYGQVFRVTCSHISDAATSNVWCAANYSSAFSSNVMRALSSIISEWVQLSDPSVPMLLAYLSTFNDLFKSSCISCHKWCIEDGAWGPLPPLCPVECGNLQNARKHFSCQLI